MATKKKATPKTPAVPLEALQAVAQDFNSFMKFAEGDEIPVDMEYDDLLSEITECAAQLEESDTIQPGTAETLEALGLEFAATVAEGESQDADEDADEDAGDDEDQNEPDNAELIAQVNKSRNVDDLLAIAKDQRIAVPPPMRKDIKKLKDYLVKKLEEGPKEDKPAGKKTDGNKSAPKATKADSYSRPMAFSEAVKKAKTEDELYTMSNDIYVKNGGKDNVKEAKWAARIGIQILQHLGLLEIDNKGKLTYNG